MARRPGPAGVLITVNVEVEVFLRHFVVGAVFTHVGQRFIKRGLQLAIVLTQADAGTITEEFFVFNWKDRQRQNLYRRVV